jgi:hypothetical protein
MHKYLYINVGDITPYDGVTKEDKRKLEEDAMHKIVADLECQIIGIYIHICLYIYIYIYIYVYGDICFARNT